MSMLFFIQTNINTLFSYFKLLNFYISSSSWKKNFFINQIKPCLYFNPMFVFIPLESINFLREFFILFFLFLAICFSVIVLISQNPIFSALALMSTYAFSGFLLICFGLEIYGIYFILIYAGAISVLILFVVMMVNLRFKEKPQGSTTLSYVFKWGFSGLIVATSIWNHSSVEYLFNYMRHNLYLYEWPEELDCVLQFDTFTEDFSSDLLKTTVLFPQLFSNDFLFIISLSLLILLIGMVGASFLVLSSKKTS